MKKDLEAQDWIKKRGEIMGKDTSRPIRFKTIQKNTKLGDFNVEEKLDLNPEESATVD